MSTVWFTSDLHLGHRLVSELRGYDTTEEHDADILARLAQAVSPGDQVWLLGDLSSGGATGQRAALEALLAVRARTRTTMHLIAGNHDGIHPLHRNAHKWDGDYRRVFDSVQPFARRRVAGRQVWLSHFPWRGGGDHTEVERYDTVRLNEDRESWIMHGHTHSPERIDRGRRQLHVGVDAWEFAPVPMSTIAELLEARRDQ